MADGAVIHTAGTLICAVLESAGYFWQAAVLDAMRDPFKQELGGLVYLVGLVTALVYTATQGGYKLGAWLLIGPPLFFAAVLDRQTIGNAEWMYGKSGRDQGKVEEQTQNLTKSSGSYNVSRLFARYIGVVSAVNREVVDTISKHRKMTDYWFLSKAELFGVLHMEREISPGLKELLHHTLIGECRPVIEAARAVNQTSVSEAGGAQVSEYNAYTAAAQARAQAEYEHAYKNTKVQVAEEGARWLAIQKLGNSAGSGAAYNTDLYEKSRKIKFEQTYTCEELWKVALDGILRHMRHQVELLKDKGEALGIKSGVLMNMMEQVEGIQNQAPIAYDDGGSGMSAESAENVARIMAKYYLRNEFWDPSYSGALARFVNRWDVRRVRGRSEGYSSFTERSRMAAEDWSERERLTNAAVTLPYYQGLALYFLAIAYPFFALLLLVPSKHTGFLLWFALWGWVKSWDIGFAAVMLLDDVFFSMLAVQKQDLGKDPKISQDMGLAFASLREIDPTFHMAAYYSIMSVCILAIPMIMGELITGGMKAGASLIAEGMNKAQEFAAMGPLGYSQQSLVGDLRNEQRMQKANAADARNLTVNSDKPTVYDYSRGLGPRTITGGVERPTGPAHGGHDPQTGKYTSQARTAGTLQGAAESQEQFMKRPSSTLYSMGDNATKAAGAYGEYQKKIIDAATTLMSTEKDYFGTAAMWDYDQTDVSVERYERMTGWKAVCIPYTNAAGIEPSEAQAKLIIGEYRQQQTEREALLNFEIAAVQEFHKLLYKGLSTALKKKVDDAGGFENLSSADRQAAMKSLSAESQKGIINTFDEWKKSVAGTSMAKRVGYTAATGAAVYAWFDGLYSTGRGLFHSVFHWPFGDEQNQVDPELRKQVDYHFTAIGLRPFAEEKQEDGDKELYGDKEIGKKLKQTVPVWKAPDSPR